MFLHNPLIFQHFQVVLLLAPLSQRQPDHFPFFSSEPRNYRQTLHLCPNFCDKNDQHHFRNKREERSSFSEEAIIIIIVSGVTKEVFLVQTSNHSRGWCLFFHLVYIKDMKARWVCALNRAFISLGDFVPGWRTESHSESEAHNGGVIILTLAIIITSLSGVLQYCSWVFETFPCFEIPDSNDQLVIQLCWRLMMTNWFAEEVVYCHFKIQNFYNVTKSVCLFLFKWNKSVTIH